MQQISAGCSRSYVRHQRTSPPPQRQPHQQQQQQQQHSESNRSTRNHVPLSTKPFRSGEAETSSENSHVTSVSKKTSPASETPGCGARDSITSEPLKPASRSLCKSRSAVVKSRLHRSVASQSGKANDDVYNEPTQLRIKYKIGRVIGEGNFATVKECTEKARKFKFALKIIDKASCRGKEQQIENEVSLLRRLRHGNIVQLIEDFDTPDRLYMVMELVTGGDLFESISAATKYTERDASGMMYHIASAVHYLHSLNIVHRDVKPENLLVHERQDGTKSLKLGDFGLASVVTKPLHTVCGTLTYVAPEVLAEVGYGLKVDIWSTGVIAYILLCGFPPFASNTNNRRDLMRKIMTGKFDFVAPYWNDISDSAKELIKNLLEVDVDKRFSAKQLLEYHWVAEDIGLDNDLHSTVANRIVELAKHDQKKLVTARQSGVAVIAKTALDKDIHHFHDRHRQ